MNGFLQLAVYGAGAALMIVGAVELIRLLVFRLWQPKGAKGFLALVVVPSGAEDCEILVRAAAQRAGWMDLEPPCRLICLDMDGEAGEIVRGLRETYPGLELLGPKELSGLFVQENGGPGGE